MRLAFLGSGSRGNGTLLEADGHRLLIDCGFSVRDATRRAAQLDVDLASLNAILVTHEHSDHSSGVAALSRQFRIPVYMTHGTCASGRIDGCAAIHCFDADSEWSLGPFRIRAVAVPHDAREPVQYCVESAGQRVGVLTDLGSATPHVCRAFDDCDALVLEFNHDRQMLSAGPYPPALKRRVGGDWGHLSNDQALALLQQLDLQRLQTLVIAHMSEKNNHRSVVEGLLEQHLPELLPRTRWAEQDQALDWIAARLSVSERPVADALLVS